MIIPKWTGSTPNAVTTGRNTGVKIIIDGDESINIPTNTRKILITKSAKYLYIGKEEVRNHLRKSLKRKDVAKDCCTTDDHHNGTRCLAGFL